MTEFANTDTVAVADDEIIVSVVEGYGHKMWSDSKVKNTDFIFTDLKVSTAMIVGFLISRITPTKR